ncbi:hypothetical protein ID866_11701 [Astraeus odoratus]|nr:hypothetical protein ID866_11701 [Astraeus odoratus]
METCQRNQATHKVRSHQTHTRNSHMSQPPQHQRPQFPHRGHTPLPTARNPLQCHQNNGMVVGRILHPLPMQTNSHPGPIPA